ncbi:hypothetical protein [Paraburkholderia sp. HD33-4]|uniref:hypothetical protein n=1 Tax=Paraburkholderia sp. HD33-4 TaxID=2883242 RepID=UPI001F437C6E|nr:hypothetical protein [Paraburkholderia sp. HD33-4]
MTGTLLRTKRLSRKPTITVGSIDMTGEHIDTHMGESIHIDSLDRPFDRGDFDLIAVACGMLVNPDWANTGHEGSLDLLGNWNADVLTVPI